MCRIGCCWCGPCEPTEEERAAWLRNYSNVMKSVNPTAPPYLRPLQKKNRRGGAPRIVSPATPAANPVALKSHQPVRTAAVHTQAASNGAKSMLGATTGMYSIRQPLLARQVEEQPHPQ